MSEHDKWKAEREKLEAVVLAAGKAVTDAEKKVGLAKEEMDRVARAGAATARRKRGNSRTGSLGTPPGERAKSLVRNADKKARKARAALEAAEKALKAHKAKEPNR